LNSNHDGQAADPVWKPVPAYSLSSISEGLHPTLMVATVEAAKVGTECPICSYGDRNGIRRFAI
jgi:hypothetical protein